MMNIIRKHLPSLSALLLAVLLMAQSLNVFAADEWQVTFTADGKMETNFDEYKDKYNDMIRGIQPGDERTFTVRLTNANKDTTDWYMTNEVINSLETQSANNAAKGGAYTYLLVYHGPTEEIILHDSSVVGGTEENIIKSREGLKSATAALEKYFYLDTLKSGESATITLTIVLDGETQGNDYQDTAANLQMNFAVEVKEAPKTPETPKKNTPTNVVKTGDDTNLIIAYSALAISGLCLLALCIRSVVLRRKRGARG